MAARASDTLSMNAPSSQKVCPDLTISQREWRGRLLVSSSGTPIFDALARFTAEAAQLLQQHAPLDLMVFVPLCSKLPPNLENAPILARSCELKSTFDWCQAQAQKGLSGPAAGAGGCSSIG